MFSSESTSSRGVADKERHQSPVFQMELNLQTIRRSTVYYLEEVDQFECMACNSLQCRCSGHRALHSPSSSYSSNLTISYASSEPCTESEYEVVCVPPPAHTLPRPRWVESPHPPPDSPDPSAGLVDLVTWVRLAKYNSSCKIVGREIQFGIDENINTFPNNSWPPLPSSIWYHRPGAPEPAPLSKDPAKAR